ncbi:MAG: hypothetical protein K2O71_07905, partial [Lachnospiraceae bacterium]|nr:hypothetical protein [Lachnospiraceae bacterium]
MKSKLSGWKDVFLFTLEQTLKSKAFRISFIIMILLALAASPVINMISSGEEENNNYTITKMYVSDETGYFDADMVRAILAEGGWEVQIDMGGASSGAVYEELCARVDERENNAVLLSITAAQGPVEMFLEYSKNGEIGKTELAAFKEVLHTALIKCRFQMLEIRDEQRELLSAEVITSVVHMGGNGEIIMEQDTSLSGFQYGFL